MQLKDKRPAKLCIHSECTGCEACYNACPVDAIEMIPDTFGFLHPQINEDVCIKCYACERACLALEKQENNNRKVPEVYACWNNDAEIRDKSSSGGVFSALAKAILSNGGYVVGAAYDEKMNVGHRIIHSANELIDLRGSKYVQSRIGKVMKRTRQLLGGGNTVLFVGTPCQIEGLRKYLGKDYENLYCCDFICHGVPSPELFKDYISQIEQKRGVEIHDFNFRSKKHGWYDALRVANDCHILKGSADSYFYGFNQNISLRESCYSCPSLGLPRHGDITIADYWRIGMKYKFNATDTNKGVSLVLLNNAKGDQLFSRCIDQLSVRKRTLDDAVSGNKPMVAPSTRNPLRNEYYECFAKEGYQIAEQRYLRPSKKSAAIAFMREYFPSWLIKGLRGFNQYIAWIRNGRKTL